MDDDDQLEAIVDYIRFARDRLNDMLCEPDLLEKWSREELAEISEAANKFTDVYEIMRRRRQDREILTSWLG
jgi:hypothetical protein